MTARLSRRLTAGALTVAALGFTAASASAISVDDGITVNATVPTTITVDAGADISFPTVPGEELNHAVTVVANDQYNLSVAATGTLPLEMKLDAADTPAGTNGTGFAAYTLLGTSAAIGSRTVGITDATLGDKWLLDLRTALGAFPEAGSYSSVVTFTAASLP